MYEIFLALIPVFMVILPLIVFAIYGWKNRTKMKTFELSQNGFKVEFFKG